jgi:ATP-dependent DNA helicase RecQ
MNMSLETSPVSDAGPAIPDIQRALQTLGYTEFRPGQREAIETLLAQSRALLVAPTGGGKSLIYQLPALLLDGTTVVISPLISLMQDQVSALEERGVAATFLASTLPPNELDARSRGIAAGRYRLVYVAPERLVFPGFRAMLRDLQCPLIAVDEAHCISEWGHDFRPEYMQIGQVIKELPTARVLACTATATPVVRDEILERLGLPAETPYPTNNRSMLNIEIRSVLGPRPADSRWDAHIIDTVAAHHMREPHE